MKLHNAINNQNGFTYLLALVLIIIMGIMLGAVGQTWQTVMKREREAELLFRGSQIREAINLWNKSGPGRPPISPLNDLKHLLEDPRTVDKVRYLRRMYIDPVTGKDWEIIRDNPPIRGIIGVRSTSQEAPLKVDNFPDDLKDLSGKKKYSEWEFKYAPAAPQTGTPPGQPGRSGTASQTGVPLGQSGRSGTAPQTGVPAGQPGAPSASPFPAVR